MGRCRLCARLARTQFDALHAALQARGKLGDQLPWVSLIINDIAVLRDNVGGKLDELPQPQVSLQGYWRIAKEYPQAWKELVNTYHTVDDDSVHKPPVSNAGLCADASPMCEICGTTWASHRKLAAHKWAKH